jgi:hypothetical protein
LHKEIESESTPEKIEEKATERTNKSELNKEQKHTKKEKTPKKLEDSHDYDAKERKEHQQDEKVKPNLKQTKKEQIQKQEEDSNDSLLDNNTEKGWLSKTPEKYKVYKRKQTQHAGTKPLFFVRQKQEEQEMQKEKEIEGEQDETEEKETEKSEKNTDQGENSGTKEEANTKTTPEKREESDEQKGKDTDNGNIVPSSSNQMQLDDSIAQTQLVDNDDSPQRPLKQPEQIGTVEEMDDETQKIENPLSRTATAVELDPFPFEGLPDAVKRHILRFCEPKDIAHLVVASKLSWQFVKGTKSKCSCDCFDILWTGEQLWLSAIQKQVLSSSPYCTHLQQHSENINGYHAYAEFMQSIQ